MSNITTKNPQFTLRFGTPDDAELVVSYMKKLGSYQKMADKITAEASEVRKILREKRAEVLFGDFDGKIAVFLYFYSNSSAFIGQRGLFIDGFYIENDLRSKGLGKLTMQYLSKLAVERGCQRLEWACLDWNTPTIAFYEKLGAYKVENMSIYRFSPEVLKDVANGF